MFVELALFLTVLVISYVIAPKQGDLPKAGYELIILLVGSKGVKRLHIHHWIYIAVILAVVVISRAMSKAMFSLFVIVSLALISRNGGHHNKHNLL